MGRAEARVGLRVVVGVVLSGAAAWACEIEGDPPTLVPLAEADDAVDAAYCERMFDCECAQGRRYDSLDACKADVDGRVEGLRSRAEVTGLAYDPACIGAWIDELDAVGCAAAFDDDDDDDECQRPCNPLHGDVPVGGACTDRGGDSDCAQGLRCDIELCEGENTCTGLCADPCLGTCPGGCADDERCDDASATCVALPGLGESCEDDGQCAPGLGCRYEEGEVFSATCIALPREGESCSQLGLCADDLRCDFDPLSTESTCVGPTPQGGACSGHLECASGYCPAGFCSALPGEGDSCAGTFACAPGLDCDGETERCIPGDPLLCSANLDLP